MIIDHICHFPAAQILCGKHRMDRSRQRGIQIANGMRTAAE
jgi:hypothetical protein